MPTEVQFTQTHAEKLAAMDNKLDTISVDIKELRDHMDKCYGGLEARTHVIELFGSEKAKGLEARVIELENNHQKLKEQVDYERGRLAFIFISIGAAISALISWWVSHVGGGS